MNPNNVQHPSNEPPYQVPPHPAQAPTPPARAPGYDQPVAYDQSGRPLYAHPPTNTQQQPQMVYLSRPATPQEVDIPEEVKRRHEESRKKYPHLNISEAEYVISAVKRHPIGILQIWAVAVLLMGTFGVLFGMLMLSENSILADSFDSAETANTVGVALLGVLFTLIGMGAFLATYIYNSNRFYLTNESVIQEIQTSLFNRHEQTVSLSNIEDASYKQDGIVAHLIGYGTIRLSTEGDETTYRFTYVTNPKRHIAVLNNAVEAFKNGRPVEMPTSDQPS
jgi:uncharacterized membrane protein YdbT with pleckstrin-like domain